MIKQMSSLKSFLNYFFPGTKYGSRLPEIQDFYSYLNMEDIADADYTNKKEFVKFLN